MNETQVKAAQLTYSNLEIVNLVMLALAYGNPEALGVTPAASIVVRSWKALDDTFKNGRKQGYEQGYEDGCHAAKEEAMTAEEAAAAASHQVIEGLCRTVWKKAE
jgi:hypothetical protein